MRSSAGVMALEERSITDDSHANGWKGGLSASPAAKESNAESGVGKGIFEDWKAAAEARRDPTALVLRESFNETFSSSMHSPRLIQSQKRHERFHENSFSMIEHSYHPRQTKKGKDV